jgi:tetratricopeptide (TPR) repeat protein
LADTRVQMGDRETAIPLYAHLLIDSARRLPGRSFTSGDLPRMIRIQQSALDALTQGPTTPAMIPPFAGLAEALSIVEQRSASSNRPQVQELYQGSIRIFQQLAQADPDNIDPMLALWSMYGLLGKVSDPEDAVKVAQDGVALIKILSERDPANVTLLRNLITSQRQLGDALQEKKDVAGAGKAYREALGTAKSLAARDPSIEPKFWSDLYQHISFEFGNMGDGRSAIDIDSEWIELQPGSPEARNARCWDRAIVGDLEPALADCNEAIRLKPDDADALDSRGFTYLKLGKLALSIADYDAALKLGNSAYTFFGRGLAKVKSGDADGGSSDIAEAKRRKDDIEQIFKGMGVK